MFTIPGTCEYSIYSSTILRRNPEWKMCSGTEKVVGSLNIFDSIYCAEYFRTLSMHVFRLDFKNSVNMLLTTKE